jgi:polyisoprenoid-binding protein YceI
MDTLAVVPVPHGDIHLEVHIPVAKMDCGRNGINRDMKNTLDASRFPFITYKLERNQLQGLNTADDYFVFDINTWGKLQISGNERTEEIPIKGTFLGPWRFRVQGAHRVNMRDFGLQPPSPMMGLIKVDDMLTVHFDVTFCLRSCDAVVVLE